MMDIQFLVTAPPANLQLFHEGAVLIGAQGPLQSDGDTHHYACPEDIRLPFLELAKFHGCTVQRLIFGRAELEHRGDFDPWVPATERGGAA